jgi:hypothetical protein
MAQGSVETALTRIGLSVELFGLRDGFGKRLSREVRDHDGPALLSHGFC